ncbi:MAG: hypothetical protein KME64_29625 [Scytonematopsis contorta HA4267-MV1]|jgi:hypothetical protein|nr:hypothetical protein [Scytonematopsis contorta HA4267-MV1]
MFVKLITILRRFWIFVGWVEALGNPTFRTLVGLSGATQPTGFRISQQNLRSIEVCVV